ncbi:MAG TPA: hypothetical protein VLA52_15395 [Thermohalobaculum sp.]|nr:hypothetical protein [Thermohalobaculum sp.]
MNETVARQDRLINQQQLRRMIRNCAAYPQLEELFGPARASEFSELVFEAELSKRAPGNLYITLSPAELPEFDRYLNAVVGGECNQVNTKREYVMDLLRRALEGSLRKGLDLPEPSGDKHGKISFRQEDTESEIKKAADWICLTMHSNPHDQVVDMLRDAVADAPPKAVLGQDTGLLDRIHKRVAPGAPRLRGPNPEMPYPSNVGGRMLLETVFQWTANAEWPAAGDSRWFDVALFYLGVIGTVQGFPDGNKRVARSAYAIALLRNRCRFVAPSRELVADLFKMRSET